MTTIEKEDSIQRMRDHVRAHVKEIAGDKDTSGLELVILIRMVENLVVSLGAPTTQGVDLSGPRWSLLLRLMGEERAGKSTGITPTYLSRVQHVSKNTISSLLRGLEEQGLVERALDPADHRLFRIRLTPAGREVMKASAASYIDKLNQMVSEMSLEERQDLGELLAKMYHSIKDNASLDCDHLELHHHGG